MRAVVQRVLSSSVTVDGKTVGSIKAGVNILLGVHQNDTPEQARWLAEKIAHLRIFEDDNGKMNKSLRDVGGSALVISQFTLYGDCEKGRRPSFTAAAGPAQAKELYQAFMDALKAWDVPVEAGIFQADMKVSILNDGPVTVIVDTPAVKEKAEAAVTNENPLGLRSKEWIRFQKEAEQLKRNLLLRKKQGRKNG